MMEYQNQSCPPDREQENQAVQQPAVDHPVYCWNYGTQTAYDTSARPARRRGALVFALVMAAAFLVSFGALIAVLVLQVDGPYDQYYDQYQPSIERVEERVIYVREYDSESGVLTIPEIAAKVKPSVVGVEVMKRTGIGIGTGFIIRSNGYIATNFHVIDGAASITVIMNDGTEHTAVLVGGDALTDLAVLKIEGENFPAVELGDSSSLLVGEMVVAIGTPSGLELAGTVTDGIVSAIDRNVKIYDDNGTLQKRMTLIQTNANINPGNSGGPLINDRGQVIGITTMKLAGGSNSIGYEGLGFALPINGAQEILNSIIETGTAGESSFVTGRPVLGITGGNVSRAAGYAADGILVTSLLEGYASVNSGLQVDDIIVAINNIYIKNTTELSAILEDLNGGDIVVLIVNRAGTELEIQLELGWD